MIQLIVQIIGNDQHMLLFFNKNKNKMPRHEKVLDI